METDGGGTSVGEEKLHEMLPTDLDIRSPRKMAALMQKRRQAPSRRKELTRKDRPATYPEPTPHHSGAMGVGGRVALTTDDGDEIWDMDKRFTFVTNKGSVGKKETDGGGMATWKQETSGGGTAARKHKAHKIHMRLKTGGRARSMKLQRLLLCHEKHKFDKVRDTIPCQDPSLEHTWEDKAATYDCMDNFQSICEPQGRGDIGKSGDMDELCGGSSNMNQLSIMEVKHGGMSVGNDERNRDPHTLPQEQCEFSPSICFNMNQDSSVGSPVAQHASSDSRKNVDMDRTCSGISNLDEQHTIEIEYGDMFAGEEDVQQQLTPPLTWDQLVVEALHVVRCREFTEYTPKTDLFVPTRFCRYNIAFFDLDKESNIVPRPPISKVPATNFWCFEHSVNVISIKVAESDVGYPINIYGTVLARDQYDYRCIYLFNRSRDNPQLIKSKKDMLALTGPFRALAVTDSMFFEVHLKIKSDDAVDKIFSKALLEHNASHHTRQPMAVSLKSWLSTVVMVYSPVPFAVEASLKVDILDGAFNFNGKVTAWTTGNRNKITLYDSKVAGTQTKLEFGGSVTLTRAIVAVPLDEGLVLKISRKAECFELVLPHDVGHDVEQYTRNLGPYELQVKVVWSAVNRKRRPKMWKRIGNLDVLW